MYQLKTEFCTQILICLKSSLPYIHLRNDSMVIKQLFIYTATYVKNISIKCQYITILFSFRKLYYYNLFNETKFRFAVSPYCKYFHIKSNKNKQVDEFTSIWTRKASALLPGFFGLKLLCKYKKFYKDIYSFNQEVELNLL